MTTLNNEIFNFIKENGGATINEIQAHFAPHDIYNNVDGMVVSYANPVTHEINAEMDKKGDFVVEAEKGFYKAI